MSNSCFKQLFFSLMLGKSGPKHEGVSGLYSSTINLIKLCAFVGLNCTTCIVKHRMGNA